MSRTRLLTCSNPDCPLSLRTLPFDVMIKAHGRRKSNGRYVPQKGFEFDCKTGGHREISRCPLCGRRLIRVTTPVRGDDIVLALASESDITAYYEYAYGEHHCGC